MLTRRSVPEAVPLGGGDRHAVDARVADPGAGADPAARDHGTVRVDLAG